MSLLFFLIFLIVYCLLMYSIINHYIKDVKVKYSDDEEDIEMALSNAQNNAQNKIQ